MRAPWPDLDIPTLAGSTIHNGNDSGPAHMAAAFGLPVIVLFGSSDVNVWCPWKTQGQALVGADGMASISVEQVNAALAKLRVPA